MDGDMLIFTQLTDMHKYSHLDFLYMYANDNPMKDLNENKT